MATEIPNTDLNHVRAHGGSVRSDVVTSERHQKRPAVTRITERTQLTIGRASVWVRREIAQLS